MNFALIVDSCKVNSYTIRNNKAYKLSKPEESYNFHHSVGNECFIGFWGYPFVFNGHFINWSEWGDKLPQLDLDLIFVAIESDFNKYKISDLRKSYPNSKIVAVLKETWNWKHSVLQRLKVYDECDYMFTCISEDRYKEFMPELAHCKVNVDFLPQPVNIDFLYKNYYQEERNELIFSYSVNHNSSRVGKTLEFTKYISNKYNIPYIDTLKPLWADFLKVWTPSTFHFNLDPTKAFPGQQSIQCAALGVVHIGGLNDAHSYLWPETATNDFDQLEYYFSMYLNDYDKRIEVIQNAFDKLNKTYSYESVYNKTLSLLYGK
jgi:hypothetical protein